MIHYHYYLIFILHLDFLNFYLLPPLLPQDPIQDPTLRLVIISPQASLGCDLLRLSLFLIALTILRGTCWVFWKVLPSWFCLMFFSRSGWILWFGGRRPQRESAIFITYQRYSYLRTTNMTYHSWCWPWSPVLGSVCQDFPLWSGSFFTFPHSTF